MKLQRIAVVFLCLMATVLVEVAATLSSLC